MYNLVSIYELFDENKWHLHYFILMKIKFENIKLSFTKRQCLILVLSDIFNFKLNYIFQMNKSSVYKKTTGGIIDYLK